MANVLSLFVFFFDVGCSKGCKWRRRQSPFLFLPFVSAAFFITIGLIYSTDIKISGVLLGPVFLPMLFVIPGVIIGLIVKKFITAFIK